MSAPRGRIRGFIRRPTSEELTVIGEKEYLHLTPAEADQYVRVVDGMMLLKDGDASPLSPPRGPGAADSPSGSPPERESPRPS